MITSNWCLDFITPIHNGGIKSNPDNYRGICVMNSLLKVLCTIINNRLVEYTELSNLINHGQIGFKKSNITTDHVFTLKSLINKYVYDNKKKLYTCFIDFKKAFDSIWHKGLFNKLEINNINGKFLDLLKSCIIEVFIFLFKDFFSRKQHYRGLEEKSFSRNREVCESMTNCFPGFGTFAILHGISSKLVVTSLSLSNPTTHIVSKMSCINVLSFLSMIFLAFYSKSYYAFERSYSDKRCVISDV